MSYDLTMEMINLGEDEPDVFYDCYEEEFDASLQSVARNFYHHVADGNCFTHHDHGAGQIIHQLTSIYNMLTGGKGRLR